MPKAPRSSFVFATLLVLASPAAAQQVWITSFENMGPGEKPNGYRFDYNNLSLPGVIQVSMAYTRVFPTAGIDVFINGTPQQFSCQINDTPGGGTATCEAFLPYSCGKMRVFVRRAEAPPGGVFQSSPVDIFSYDNQRCLPQCDSCQLTTIGQGPGKPVNVATGKLWYRSTDLALSGPFGLSFTRWYDNQSPYNVDLAFGWRHTYSAHLDLSLAGGQNRRIAFRDEEDRVTYFIQVFAGTSVHDDTSGADLALNAAGSIYTLTTWSGAKYTFDAQGRLASLIDRIGNTQTITRDAMQRIDFVTDALGRQLDFGYDASNRIVSVTTNPPGLSLSFTYSGANCPSGNLCSATMPDGRIWTYEYTTSGNNLTRVIDPNGNAEEINTYSGERIATQKTQGDQNLLTFAYPSGTTTTVMDGLSRTTTYTYNPKLLVVTNVAGPGCSCGGGQSRAFTFDPFLRKTSETDGIGSTHTITWTYGRDVVATFPGGFTDILNAYPSPTQRTEPLSAGVSRTTTWAYYALTDARRDLVQTETAPSADTSGQSKLTTFTYNTQGLLTSRAEQGWINGVQTTYTTGFTYDAKGRLFTADGPRTDVTDVTTNTYYPDTDADMARRGQLETVTDAASNVTTYASGAVPFNTYTLYGQPRRVSDPNGVLREMTYDNRGRLTVSTLKGVTGDPLDLTTAYHYDAGGRLQKVVLSNLNDTFYLYDGSNRLTEIIRRAPDGASKPLQHERLRFTYNVMSEKTHEEAQVCPTPALTCAAWVTKRSDDFQYDAFGRLWQVNHPDTSTIFYTYDAAGNLQMVRDENHASPNTTYGYDRANRLTSVTQTLVGAPGNQIQTLYDYDVQDNLNSVTDPNTNNTTYLFDDFRRMRRQTSPVTGVTNYTHDPASNLLTLTDANTATTTRTYDALNRVLTATSVRSGFPTEAVTFTYDSVTSGNFGKGRLASMTDPSGSASYAYERRGLLRQENRTIQGNAYALGYAYDGNGNRRQVTYPSGLAVNYTFDFADRPLSATPATGTTFVTSAKYRPFGPLEQIRYGNGTTKTMDYDSRYRPILNKLEKDVPLTTLAHYTLAPDFVGNLTGITDVQNAGYNRTYGYDDLHRLTTTNSGASLWGNGSTAYDSMGNLTSLTLGTARTATFAYVSTTPKLSSVTETGFGMRNVSYDSAGNETAVGAGTFSYSARNNLASGDVFAYTYDGNGLRCIATVAPSRRYSFYNPEMNLLAETYLTTVTPPPIQHEYIWFAGQPVAQIDDRAPDVTSWDFTDHLGTPFIQTDSAGNLIWRAEYEPYGRIFALRTANRYQPLRLPGQEAEELNMLSIDGNGATERSYNVFRWYRNRWGRYSQTDPLTRGDVSHAGAASSYRARFYDQELGRFLAESAYGVVGGLQLFSYVRGNPMSLVDPLGLQFLPGDFPAAGARLGCAIASYQDEYAAALDRGNRTGQGGWRFAHCMASCRAKKCGYPPIAIRTAGRLSEYIQVQQCLFLERGWTGPACESAWADADFRDNLHGSNCMPGESCKQRCRGHERSDKEPQDFGPFWGGARP